MVTFKICIAEITVEITAVYESTKSFCNEYLTDSAADLSVQISQSDIDSEREKSKKSGNEYAFSDEYLETLAVYRKIAERLPFYNAFLFHGSAVAVDSKAYIFTAVSGTGKSTHTAHYRKIFGNRAVMVNDDKPIILLKDNKAFACGTPWSGKHELNNNIIIPIKAICVLERGKNNSIKQVKPNSVLDKIISQSFRPAAADSMHKFLTLIENLSECADFYTLTCNKKPESAIISFEGMNK